MTRPTYSQLMQSDSAINAQEDFNTMSIGHTAAILWRKNVESDWEECVVQRTATDSFKVWSSDGKVERETYTHGRDEDGAPLNDCVEEEWTLTLGQAVSLKPASDSHIALGTASKCASSVHVCVGNAIQKLLSATRASALPPPPPPTDPLPGESGAEAKEKKGVENSRPDVPTADGNYLQSTYLEPRVGARCLLNGHSAYIWSIHSGHVAVVFDDATAPWEAMPLDKFSAISSPIIDEPASMLGSSNSGHGAVEGVILERHAPRSASCPAATLRRCFHAVAEDSGWRIFFEYLPGPIGKNFASLPSSYAASPLHSGMRVTCSPPFVSAGKGENGANIAPTPFAAVQGVLLGIFIGSEFNSSKEKEQQRRWALVSIRDAETEVDVDCFLPFEKLSRASDESTSAAADSNLLINAFEIAIVSAAQNRKPQALHSAFTTAVKRHNLRLQLRNNESLMSTSDNLEETRRSERKRRGSSLENPIPVDEKQSTSQKKRSNLPPSGIPLGLVGCGESKLDGFTKQQLLLALTENGLPQPPTEFTDKFLWAKQQLMRKYKNRNHSGWKKHLNEAAVATKEVAGRRGSSAAKPVVVRRPCGHKVLKKKKNDVVDVVESDGSDASGSNESGSDESDSYEEGNESDSDEEGDKYDDDRNDFDEAHGEDFMDDQLESNSACTRTATATTSRRVNHREPAAAVAPAPATVQPQTAPSFDLPHAALRIIEEQQQQFQTQLQALMSQLAAGAQPQSMQPTAQPTQQSSASCSELQAGVRASQPAQSSARAKAASDVEAESVRGEKRKKKRAAVVVAARSDAEAGSADSSSSESESAAKRPRKQKKAKRKQPKKKRAREQEATADAGYSSCSSTPADVRQRRRALVAKRASEMALLELECDRDERKEQKRRHKLKKSRQQH